MIGYYVRKLSLLTLIISNNRQIFNILTLKKKISENVYIEVIIYHIYISYLVMFKSEKSEIMISTVIQGQHYPDQ